MNTRIRIRGFALAWLLCFSACGLERSNPLGNVRAVVVNSLSEDLSLIGYDEPPTIQKSVVKVGAAPNQILVLGDEVVVLSSRSNSLQIIDPKTWQVVREYLLGDGCNPYWMAPTEDRLLAITCNQSNELLLVDPKVALSVSAVKKRLAMPSGDELMPFDSAKPSFARPQGVEVIGHKAYVTLTNLGADYFAAGPGLALVVDLTAWTKGTLIVLPHTNPTSMVGNAKTMQLYVSCAGFYDGTGTIEIIDTTSETVASSVAIGGAPGKMWLDQDDMAWVGDFLDGRLLRFNAANNNQVLDPLPLCPSDPANNIFNFISDVADDGQGTLFALCFASDEVKVISLAQPDLGTKSLAVGDGPQAMLVVEP